jgi:hypothetical protein
LLLHCDKFSSFGHIEAAPIGFVLLALIVSGDNSLNVWVRTVAVNLTQLDDLALQGAYQEVLPARTMQAI